MSPGNLAKSLLETSKADMGSSVLNREPNISILLALLSILLLISNAGCVKQPGSQIGSWPESLKKDLSYYPYFFFEDKLFIANVIVDKDARPQDIDSARELIASLEGLDKSISYEIKKYPTFSDLNEHAILIGSCSQDPKNRFVNIYVDCLSMKPDQAIIRIIDHNGAWLLFVVGYDENLTNHAIQVLKSYKEYSLKGQDVEVVPTKNGYRIGEPT